LYVTTLPHKLLVPQILSSNKERNVTHERPPR
jgi:hypothetical protein